MSNPNTPENQRARILSQMPTFVKDELKPRVIEAGIANDPTDEQLDICFRELKLLTLYGITPVSECIRTSYLRRDLQENAKRIKELM